MALQKSILHFEATKLSLFEVNLIFKYATLPLKVNFYSYKSVQSPKIYMIAQMCLTESILTNLDMMSVMNSFWKL